MTVDPTWSQTQELTAIDGVSNNYLGATVAMSGTTAMVSAFHRTVGSNANQGTVYIFSESGGAWSQSAELTASDGASGDLFGEGIALSGSVALVGAPGKNVSGNAGEGVVYEFNKSGSSWTQAAEFTDTGGAANDNFGAALALWGSTLIVDAATKTVSGHSGQGAAFVFTESGGSWSQSAELTASDGAAGDEFGATSVAIAGSTVVVGARTHTVSGHSYQGTAYVFSGGGSSWSQTAELTSSDGVANDFFGTAVATSGSTVMVGAPDHTVSGHEEGTVYVYNTSGGSWVLTSELTSPSSGGLLFGNALALSGPTVVIGDVGEDVGGTIQGAAYLFTLGGTSWTEAAELTASDGASGDELGYGVALSASGVVAGAPFHTLGVYPDQGAAYLYSTALSVAPAPATAIATGEASKNSVGCSHKATPGDPVDCASGDFYHTFTDVSIPGYGPLLDLTRTYNSLDAGTEGIFGYGWISSYESHLVVKGDGSITITEGDGSQVTATPSGGTYTVPSWADSTLVANLSGTYTFVRQGTQIFTYNSSGQLTSIADPNGATTALAYSSGKLPNGHRPLGSYPHLRLRHKRLGLDRNRPHAPGHYVRIRRLRKPDVGD